MSLNYARELLKVSLSQLCDVIGFDRTSQLAMDILVDVCERQFQYLAKQTCTLLQLTERDQPTYFDLLAILFENNSQNLLPFQEYLGHFRSLPFSQEILRFPVQKRNQFYLRIPPKDSEELLQREQNQSTEYIYHWLPLFPHRECLASPLSLSSPSSRARSLQRNSLIRTLPSISMSPLKRTSMASKTKHPTSTWLLSRNAAYH